jgi:hypothetical protein
MSLSDGLHSNPQKDESLGPLLQEVEREGLIQLLDYILQKQVNHQPCTGLELLRHFLESSRGSKISLALGQKKLLQRLSDMDLILLKKQVGKVTVPCLELTERGMQYLQKLRNSI